MMHCCKDQFQYLRFTSQSFSPFLFFFLFRLTLLWWTPICFNILEDHTSTWSWVNDKFLTQITEFGTTQIETCTYYCSQSGRYPHPLWMYPTIWSSTKNSTNSPFLSCKNPKQIRRHLHTYTHTSAHVRTQQRSLPFLGCRCRPSGSTRRGRARRRARRRRRRGGRRPSRSPQRKRVARRTRRKQRRRTGGGGGGERGAGSGPGSSGERRRRRRRRRWWPWYCPCGLFVGSTAEKFGSWVLHTATSTIPLHPCIVFPLRCCYRCGNGFNTENLWYIQLGSDIHYPI